MRRATVIGIAVVLGLMAGELFAQPPDTTPNSPVPPLRMQPVRNPRTRATNRAQGPTNANGASDAGGATITTTNGLQPAPYSNVNQTNDANSGDYNAERRRIWDSAEMKQARTVVLDHSRRSVRIGEREGQLFLSRLSQLSPQEMQDWLNRFQAHQQRLAQAQEAQDAGRQMSVETALDRLESTQQAFENINSGQSYASDTVRTQLQSRDELAVQLLEAIRSSRGSIVLAGPQFTYDPFAPTFDPASPNAYTRRAAAASLPGDLSRGDALNFVRGDVNPDSGDVTGVRGLGTVNIGAVNAGGGTATGNLGAVTPGVTGGGAGAAAEAGGAGAGGGGGGGP